MGLVVCRTPEELDKAIDSVRNRGKTLFKNEDLFLEKYIANAR